MRTITNTYNVYEFDELSELAKETALDNLRDINVDYDGWSDTELDEAKERLQELGFEDAKIYFSGFWSQGDGASFTCTINLEKWCKRNKKARLFKKALNAYSDGYAKIAITKSGHYEHEYTMQIDIENWTPDEKFDAVDEQLFAIGEWAIEEARKEARKIYDTLRNSYVYLTSDEAIKETIETNGYEFTEEGKLV